MIIDHNKPPLWPFTNRRLMSFVVLALILSFSALSAIDETAIHKAMVRVEANKKFASGFLFGGENNVVTSLHAVLPPPEKIEIYCAGVAVGANVIKYSKEADLVLLKATSNLKELGCEPYPDYKINTARPNAGTNLEAWGFLEAKRGSAFPTYVVKGSARTETLAGLVGDNSASKVRDDPNMIPKHDLPIYQISGKLIPGLSGGPIFLKESTELIGIVEGGLDYGVTHHTWAMPAGNLQKLLDSEDNNVLPNINPSDFGFSSPSADPIKIKPASSNTGYSWIKSKTMSYQQIIQTSDESLGLEELVDFIFPELEDAAAIDASRDALYALNFDIYEETDQGVIIAVPEGSKLEEKGKDSKDSKDYYLVVQNENGTADFEVDYGSNKIIKVWDANEQVVHPSEQRYFAEALDEFMFDKCQDSQSSCFYDDVDAPAITIDFGHNRKLMRFSYHTEIIENGNFVEAEYFAISILVKGDKVMKVDSLTVINQDSAVLQCMTELTAQACGKPYWKQAAFLIAARLSSFTNLGDSSAQSKPTVLNYQCEICADLNESIMLGEQDEQSEQSEQSEHDNSTADWSITYVNQQSVPLFMQLADGSWLINMQGEYMQATVQGQQTFPDGNEHVILVYQDTFYAVPFNGGYYQMAPAGGEWSAGETVYTQTNE